MTASDLHLFDPALGSTGSAFEVYLASDRKLLREGEAILDSALARVLDSKPDFFLVSGDLTKDGEEQDHRLLATKLSVISAAGIKVFVIPGNHDILNPEAYSYSGDTKTRVPNIGPEAFASIYGPYGYDAAIRRDPDSLSYVAEPVPGLWLLAIDTCVYAKNPSLPHPETRGELSGTRLAWALAALRDAQNAGKAVIAMEHHGIVEHYPSQRKYYREYLLDDFEKVGAKLAAEGLRLVFTGHFHANDATIGRFPASAKAGEGNWLLDIETGSLVTAPCPLRTVELDGNRISVSTLKLPSAEGYPDLQAYAKLHTSTGIAGMAVDAMLELKVPVAEARSLAPRIAEAFVAHYAGDEKRPAGELLPTKGLSLIGRIVVANRRPLVEGLWTDLPPVDNDFVLDLQTGEAP
jgi:hypothetical protein